MDKVSQDIFMKDLFMEDILLNLMIKKKIISCYFDKN